MSGGSDSRRIVLTGASRGLGLDFTRQWLEAGHHVFALARRPDESAGLRGIRDKYPDTLWSHPCDVTSDASVSEAARAVEETWGSVDWLLNNAGIFGSRTDLQGLDLEDVRQVFEVNTLGALRVTREFLPLLRRGSERRVVMMSSLMGSIGDNGSGGDWSYRLSKAAMNMSGRNLAHELGEEGIVCTVLHPGWVQTDMGGSAAPLEVADSVGSMVRTIASLGPEHNGVFLDRDGQVMPW